MTEIPWYDSKEGIQEAIDKGIGGLVELRKARHEAGYDRKECMAEWCLFGYYSLSTNGNFDKIIEGAPRTHPRGWKLGDVATWEEAKVITGEGWGWSTTTANLPPVVEKCQRCLYGWDKRNITDYHDRRQPTSPHIHETCHRLQVIDDEIEFFQDVLKGAGMADAPIRIIPNEYHSGIYNNPWFIIESKWGPIRIGWRKSVINIDWSDSRIKHKGRVLLKEFHDKGITIDDQYAHAYGKDNAVTYLRALSEGN
jgi:hypothetical protein